MIERLPVERLEFPGGEASLWGELWLPAGDPPFPTVVWNHGSKGRQRGLLSPRYEGPTTLEAWLGMGLAVFAPSRRGYDGAPGESLAAALGGAEPRSPEQDRRLCSRLLAESDDVLAAARFLRGQHWADGDRLVCSGYSLGAITTALVLSRSREFAAGVAFALGAILWQDHPGVRQLLLTRMARVSDPMMILQAKNDYDTAPCAALAAVLEAGGVEHRARIYPATGSGPEEGHLFCALGTRLWTADVQEFLRGLGVLPAGESASRPLSEARGRLRLENAEA